MLRALFVEGIVNAKSWLNGCSCGKRRSWQCNMHEWERGNKEESERRKMSKSCKQLLMIWTHHKLLSRKVTKSNVHFLMIGDCPGGWENTQVDKLAKCTETQRKSERRYSYIDTCLILLNPSERLWTLSPSKYPSTSVFCRDSCHNHLPSYSQEILKSSTFPSPSYPSSY